MEVHGISNEMLADKPLFEHIAEEFLAFVEGAELVIHNAPFDIGFINHELSLLAGPVKDITRICTRSEEHTSELQSRGHLVCRLLLEKKKMKHCFTNEV